jgi:hypothetical protein
MSILGDAVQQEFKRRKIDIDGALVEKVLLDAGISSMASRGVPARLRVRRLRVTGVKHYSETPGVDTAPAQMKTAPIDLDWTPGDGVNGVGSAANLRGKSSVLHLTMWALTGRSHLQADVLSWVDHVAAEFTIDGVTLYVEFDVKDGVPSGTVSQQVPSGNAVLGMFIGEAEFEAVMGSVMLDRLRLDTISVFSKGVETEHAWPSYAAALTVHADKLDPIVGNENTLKTRILQMFVGTSWAAIDAQAATALNALQFERNEFKAQRQAAASVTATGLAQAEGRVTVAQANLDKFDPAEPDMGAVFSLASAVSERARDAHELSLQVMTAGAAESEVRAHLRAEELRRQIAAEDAVARRMFNGMTPAVCPRCSTAVAPDRLAAEPTTHECSLCTNDLLLDVQAMELSEKSASVAAPLATAAGRSEEEEFDDDDEGVDSLEALRAAVAEAREGVAQLQTAHRAAEAARVEAEVAAQRGQANLDSARARLSAELELARAESALETLRGATASELTAPVQDEELRILDTASQLTKKWVKEDQDPLLESVSETISKLARRFGATNITAVGLKGNGNMTVHKGGASTGYSDLTNGEKLRIKIAAVIALIELGHNQGVGRHPGLLFVDSPAAEEVPEADLQTMLEAMQAVAEKTNLQIVVATTHGPMLTNVLREENLLVATGTNFVW